MCVAMHTVRCLISMKRSTLDILLLGPKDPIPLWHFGLKEVKARVDLMEDQFDRPMVFDPALIPDPAVAGQSVGAWGDRVWQCAGLQEASSVLALLPLSCPVCMDSSVRRRWTTLRSIFSSTAVINWNR